MRRIRRCLIRQRVQFLQICTNFDDLIKATRLVPPRGTGLNLKCFLLWKIEQTGLNCNPYLTTVRKSLRSASVKRMPLRPVRFLVAICGCGAATAGLL